MLGSQFHPEFKSRPNHPHPLFMALLAAAVEHQEARLPQVERIVEQVNELEF
jgi:CTP synthase